MGAVGSLRLQWLIGLFLSDPQTFFVKKSISILVVVGNNFLDFSGDLAGERELIRIIVGRKRESSWDKLGFGSSLCASLSRL